MDGKLDHYAALTGSTPATPGGDNPAPLPVGQPAESTVPPMAITGVVVTKGQLLDALRVYVPTIRDFAPLPDGQHFSILFQPPAQP